MSDLFSVNFSFLAFKAANFESPHLIQCLSPTQLIITQDLKTLTNSCYRILRSAICHIVDSKKLCLSLTFEKLLTREVTDAQIV